MQERREQARSLDAAERASIDEIQRRLPAFERNGYDPGLRQIPLGNAIGTAFDCAPLHSDCHTELRKFVSISREGENWRLVIRNRWEVEMILDSKFNLVSTRNLTQPPEPPELLVPFRAR